MDKLRKVSVLLLVCAASFVVGKYSADDNLNRTYNWLEKEGLSEIYVSMRHSDHEMFTAKAFNDCIVKGFKSQSNEAWYLAGYPGEETWPTDMNAQEAARTHPQDICNIP